MENFLSIVRNQFFAEIDSVSTEIELEIIDLRRTKKLQELYQKKDLLIFSSSLSIIPFTKICKFDLLFGSTYINEETFSIMNINKNPLRMRITDEHLEAIIKSNTT